MDGEYFFSRKQLSEREVCEIGGREKEIVASGRRLSCAPLTLMQLARFHLYERNEIPSARQLASAIRLSGQLDSTVLNRSLSEMLCRHDALRTRITVLDGTPIQTISDECAHEMSIIDLRELPRETREREMRVLIATFILEPLNIAVDPLFKSWLLRLEDTEYVLVLAMEHMISDAASMCILLRDLFTAYDQICLCQSISLPPVLFQFAEYAIEQRTIFDIRHQELTNYWNRHLMGFPRVSFPTRDPSHPAAKGGWQSVPIRIDTKTKEALILWCRSRRVTLAMSMFAMYVLLVMRRCCVAEIVLGFQIDGRMDPRVENTIGFFSSVLQLRIKLLPEDRFVTFLRRIVEEYCDAYDHADFGYFESHRILPEFVKNGAFNWVPYTVNPTESSYGYAGIKREQIFFDNPVAYRYQYDRNPALLLLEGEHEIVGNLYFPARNYAFAEMESFAAEFLEFAQRVTDRSERYLREITVT